MSEAPTDVSAFVAWLARTATRDLEIAADTNRTSADEARTLSAAALGRYASAVTIAQAYGIDLDAGLDQALLVNDRVNAIFSTRREYQRPSPPRARIWHPLRSCRAQSLPGIARRQPSLRRR